MELLSWEQEACQSWSGALSASSCPAATCHMPVTLPGMGWGARASTGLGQVGNSSSLRTSTWLGGSVVLGVKEQEQHGSSWADFEGPWGRQPGGQGHVVGWGECGLRSQKYSSCDLELPLITHVVLIRLYNFLSLFKFWIKIKFPIKPIGKMQGQYKFFSETMIFHHYILYKDIFLHSHQNEEISIGSDIIFIKQWQTIMGYFI